MQQFIKNVREFYKPYYHKNDKAHSISHADDVCNLALKMNKGRYDEKLIILSAYIHDIFNYLDRARHNELAYEYVVEAKDKFLKELNSSELKLVAYAVLEHRAKFKGKFYSKLSETISSADRGEPKIELIVIRSMHFNSGDAKSVVSHIKRKYSKDGYAKFPKIYKDYFKDEVNRLQESAQNLTKEQVLKIWSSRKLTSF